MTRDKAIELMRKLQGDGLTHDAIAEELKKQGYKSERTGRPLTPISIGYTLRKEGDVPKHNVKPTPVLKRGKDDAGDLKLRLIREIMHSPLADNRAREVAINILEDDFLS